MTHYERLEKWREERELTYLEQNTSFFANILEELAEVERERQRKDYDKLIGELTDICVFCLNSTKEEESNKLHAKTDNFYDKLYKTSHELLGGPFSYSYLKTYFFKVLSILREEPFFIDEQQVGIYRHTRDLIFQMGYDFNIAMDETLKKIESRKGKLDPQTKKWVKDTSEEAKANWYTPDYSKARKWES